MGSCADVQRREGEGSKAGGKRIETRWRRRKGGTVGQWHKMRGTKEEQEGRRRRREQLDEGELDNKTEEEERKRGKENTE